jgi:hypothetical protein
MYYSHHLCPGGFRQQAGFIYIQMGFELGIGLIQDNGFFDLIIAIILVSIIDRLEQKTASLIT